MKLESLKKQLSVLMGGIVINLIILFTGMAFVVAVLFSLQRQYSIKQTQNSSTLSLNTVMDILDTNTSEAEALIDRFHRDNQAIANDVAELIYNQNYSNLYMTTQPDRIYAMSIIANAVGTNDELFVVGKDGFIKYASSYERVGINPVENGTFTKDQFELITRSYTVNNKNYNGTNIKTYNDSGVVQSDCEPVKATFGENGKEAYYYSSSNVEGEMLIYETRTNTLNTQIANIGDIGTVLSNAVMENNGFMFAINSNGVFDYYDDGNTVLTGEFFTTSGLTDAVLKDRYKGTQIINGVSYQCQSRAYSSPLYGDGLIISAALPDSMVFRSDFFTSIFTIIVFAGVALIIMIYTMFLKSDPEQIVGYDEKLIKYSGKKRRRAIRNDTGIKNTEAFRLFGRQYYFKLGIAKRIAPVIILGLAAILIVSWNSQRIAMLTKNMASADYSMEQLESLFESSNRNAKLISNGYEQKYLSKIKLISYLVESEPNALNGRVINLPGDDVVYTYLDDNYNPILNEYGKPVTSVSNSTSLKQYAKQNNIDEIFIFDDHGHIIASSGELWNFTLSADPTDQSYDFRKILTGEANDIIQPSGINDVGDARQYMGTTIYFSTLHGEGKYDGLHVSKAVYDEYTENGSYYYEGEPYDVSFHRGLIQAGISDNRIERIMQTTAPSYLMQQFEVGDGGYAVIFDNTEDHICTWSPIESDIGKTAEELGVGSNGFSGYYRGFCKVNGVDYLQYIKYNKKYWVALIMPQSVVFKGNFNVAFISMLISAVFYMIMFFVCTVSNEDEEAALEALLEERIKNTDDNSMVKVSMANGKSKYIRSASAKYHSNNIDWNSLTVSQKMAKFTNVIATLLGLTIVVMVTFEQQLFGSTSAIHFIFTGNWDRGVNYYACFYCVIILIFIAVYSSAISIFVSFVIRNMGSRVETVGRLLLSVIKYGSVLFGVFYCMTVLGISTSGVVTSAGILSVVVGLGAQSLISDILSGIFIIFEGSFRVGDIVEIDGFCGYVREIGIRTTLVEDYIGDIKIFNNSQISGILNHTKKDSEARCEIGISYNEDIERVEDVIINNLPKLKKKIPGLIGDLYYVGVLRLEDSAVTIGVAGMCNESEKRFFLRRLYRELLILFRENDINIPFPQVTISYEDEIAERQKESMESKQDSAE